VLRDSVLGVRLSEGMWAFAAARQSGQSETKGNYKEIACGYMSLDLDVKAYFLLLPGFLLLVLFVLLLVFFGLIVRSGSGVAVGAAPRILILPSFRVSVMIGLAAGRNLCCFEYLDAYMISGFFLPDIALRTVKAR